MDLKNKHVCNENQNIDKIWLLFSDLKCRVLMIKAFHFLTSIEPIEILMNLITFGSEIKRLEG